MQINKDSLVPSWYRMGHFGKLSSAAAARSLCWWEHTVMKPRCGFGHFGFIWSRATDFTTSLSQLSPNCVSSVTKQMG